MIGKKLSIVADENIPAVEEMFANYGSIKRVDGRTLSAQDLKGVDVLLVRSVTKVNQQLLANSAVKFVGSATIGVDHIDQVYLNDYKIQFTSAPGCNADAVVEYDISCINELLSQSGELLVNKTVAIIGVGNVGSRLAKRLSAIGVKSLLLNDPVRAQTESGFRPLEYCLRNADIIAMHTPLVTDGQWPTKHLVAREQLQWLKPDSILLNAGRGAAIKADDLLAFLSVRKDIKTVLDVWEHEPIIDTALADCIDIATPHIAGYTLEGKMRGTYMLKQAFCQWMNIEIDDALEDYLPIASVNSVEMTARGKPEQLIKLIYDPYNDDRALRKTLKISDQAVKFDMLRKQYPERREFYSLQIKGSIDKAMKQQFVNYGFSVK